MSSGSTNPKALVLDPLAVLLTVPAQHAEMFGKIVETGVWKAWCREGASMRKAGKEIGEETGKEKLKEMGGNPVEKLTPLKGMYAHCSEST